MKHRTSKVVPFPNLKQRLLDKGMGALQQKKFEEALELLQQTIEMDDQLEEVQLAIIVCLLELGYLDEAKQKCQTMLQQDIGDYYEVLQIYLTILIQLRQYEEVEATIEAVLQEGKIPSQTVENLYRLLDFSRKMTSNVMEEKPLVDVNLLRENLPLSEQWNIIQALRHEAHGISFAYDALDEYLRDESKHPMLKTVILHMFIEKEISRKLEVEKFGNYIKVTTGELHDITNHPFTMSVLQALDHFLGNENPSLFEVVKEMWNRHLYVIYPFIPQPENANMWAAGIHKVGYDLHGIDIDLAEITSLYQISTKDLLFTSSRIREIDDISFIEY